jgi:D-glycero-alpha-D-manno-heptose-7-phosphate kinase
MMVTSRTPLRVSLFGGGSDYPAWYRRRPGAVLGFTIDKYIYISAIRLPAFVDYRYRLTYSKLERCQQVAELQHPAVRAVLERDWDDRPLDISMQADLPANAGLGSSSSFAVGFLNLVSALRGIPRTRLELAQLAIELEHDVLHERVGIQDQLHAAFGGLNRFDFHGDELSVSPVPISGADLEVLSGWLILVYTGRKRHASGTLEEQLDRTARRRLDEQLEQMVRQVDEAERLFRTRRGDDLAEGLAETLRTAWQLKRSLSTSVSTPEIDALYERCLRHGALAGKLLGAGGGGFLLMVVPPDARERLVADLGPERCVQFSIDHAGATVDSSW